MPQFTYTARAGNGDLRQAAIESPTRDDVIRQLRQLRLNVIKIDVPPLRERPEDIPYLVQYFLDKLAVECRRTVHLSPEAMEQLQGYPVHLATSANHLQHSSPSSTSESGSSPTGDFQHSSPSGTSESTKGPTGRFQQRVLDPPTAIDSSDCAEPHPKVLHLLYRWVRSSFG